MDELMSDLDLAQDADLEESAQHEEEILEDKINEENIEPALKLDYKIKSMEERADLVQKIIDQTPPAQLTHRYLEILGDYIMQALSKEEKKSKKYLTDNRLITINKRETSFEGLTEKFENGEDGLYNLMTSDKNILLTTKAQITEEDIAEVPGLKELRQAIEVLEQKIKDATGRRKFLLKKQLIEMRREQYLLKSVFKPVMYTNHTSAKGMNKIELDEKRWIDENGEPQSDGLITFFNPKHISAILCNYTALKMETQGKYWNDFFYLMQDFDSLLEKTLKRNYPLYYDLVQLKFQGKQNTEIQEALEKKHGVRHSIEYISSLWRNKIPKLLSEKEKSDYLIWYYTYVEQGVFKKCSKCGQLKLATNRFFSKNSTSKDGLYSWCKECRSAVRKEKKLKGD